jgi:hypothetical protein
MASRRVASRYLLAVIVAVAYHAVAGHDHLRKEVLLADNVDVANGREVRSTLDGRVIGIELESLRRVQRSAALCGGKKKFPAILGALRVLFRLWDG